MSRLFADPLLQASSTVLVVFTPICIIVTGLRFYATRIAKRRIAMEDWLALGALICFILWFVFVGLLSGSSQTARDASKSTSEKAAAFKKMMLITIIARLMFPLNQLFAKLSILSLYYRIFGVFPRYGFWIKAVGALQIAHTVDTVFVNTFECVPVRKFWIPQIEGHCIDYGLFLALNEAANSLIDFGLVVQAIIMLRSLQSDQKTRWTLSIVFTIGGLAGVIGFVKIGMGVAGDVAINNQYILGAIASVQMGLSIICCCVITFKPLLTKVFIFTSELTSKASSFLGWKKA